MNSKEIIPLKIEETSIEADVPDAGLVPEGELSRSPFRGSGKKSYRDESFCVPQELLLVPRF